MAAPVSVEEKLKKFQLVCESKLRKIELLEKQYEKNEEILRGFEKDYLMHSELAKFNLNLAQAKLDVGKALSFHIIELPVEINSTVVILLSSNAQREKEEGRRTTRSSSRGKVS